MIELKRAMVVANTRLLVYGFTKMKSIIPKRSRGKKANFKCSQVLSFTALKIATNLFLPDHSYKKWRITPRIIIKAVSTICHNNN